MTVKALPAALALALILPVNVQSQPVGSAPSGTYRSDYKDHPRMIQIYKFVDSRGRVTYTSSPPGREVPAERIRVESAPTDARAEAARRRYEHISESAQILGEARLRRERAREERHRKRLERQALRNLAQPPATSVEREIVIVSPHRRRPPWPVAVPYHDKHIPRPQRQRTPSTSLPPSSFPDMFSRNVR